MRPLLLLTLVCAACGQGPDFVTPCGVSYHLDEGTRDAGLWAQSKVEDLEADMVAAFTRETMLRLPQGKGDPRYLEVCERIHGWHVYVQNVESFLYRGVELDGSADCQWRVISLASRDDSPRSSALTHELAHATQYDWAWNCPNLAHADYATDVGDEGHLNWTADGQYLVAYEMRAE